MGSGEELASKPRKQEKMLWWYAIILTVLFVASLLLKYFDVDWLVVTLAIIAFIVLIFLTTLKEKPWQYTDMIEKCKDLEFKTTGTVLDDSSDSCYVVEHGNRWRAYFAYPTPVTFGADPFTKAIVSREILTAYDIMQYTDKSEVSRSFAKENSAKLARMQSAERAGIDTGEVEGYEAN